MTQWLTLSRAARLIGVPRGALQRQVRDGELPTNDGLVSTDGTAARSIRNGVSRIPARSSASRS